MDNIVNNNRSECIDTVITNEYLTEQPDLSVRLKFENSKCFSRPVGQLSGCY